VVQTEILNTSSDGKEYAIVNDILGWKTNINIFEALDDK
jgi:hypothetical protein